MDVCVGVLWVGSGGCVCVGVLWVGTLGSGGCVCVWVDGCVLGVLWVGNGGWVYDFMSGCGVCQETQRLTV